MRIDITSLIKLAEILHLKDCPTRKLKVISMIIDYVETEAAKAKDDAGEVSTLFGQKYEAIDSTLKGAGGNFFGPQMSAGWRPPVQEDVKPLDSLLQNLATQPAATSLYRRMFKINGSVGGKDGLSYVSICSQVQDAKKSGYTDSEIVIGLKRAISSTSTLRTYMDSQVDLPLETMMTFFRDFFKQRSAAVLFSDLSKVAQKHDESATNFLLRAFDMRQQVLLATAVEDHHFDDNLVYSTFCRSVRTGLRDPAICAHMKKFLKGVGTPVADEVLLREINEASSEKDEAELKQQKRPKASVNVVGAEDDTVKQMLKPLIDNMAALTQQMKELQAQPRYVPRRYVPKKCEKCTSAKVDKCMHCWKCGSGAHFSKECKKSSGNE